MKKNKNTILLQVGRHDLSMNQIRSAIDLNQGKTFDLLHFTGIGPEERDSLHEEVLKEMVSETPEINRCYRCDIGMIVESFRDTVDDEQLLGSYQLRYIIMILAMAYFIKKEEYDEHIYYSLRNDHRLTEIPAGMILEDPEYICLTNELEGTSLSNLLARRFLVARAVSFINHKPEYGYTMDERVIRMICRKIIRSHLLETLQFEEIN